MMKNWILRLLNFWQKQEKYDKTKENRDMFSLKGKVAIVTGAAGLIGEAYCKALASAGANVILSDLDEEKSSILAQDLSDQYGIQCMALACDVTSREDWKRLVKKVTVQFNSIDILVNNAGFTNRSGVNGYSDGFESFSDKAWQGILDVNLTGVFLGCQIVGNIMKSQGSGSIINIASLYGVVSPNHRIYKGTGINQPVAYSVSKAGVIALTKYLATYWGTTGIRVNAITPGGIFDNHTDPFLKRFKKLNPMGRMGSREDMSGALIYLASDASAYVTGHNLVVDGGWTIW